MPLLFDMPLEQLPAYQGTNPRPADHDEYWERALAEMRAQEPQVELIPADFQTDFADCFHLWFTGVRGARVHAKFLRPKAPAGPGPAVLMFHGYSGNSGLWLDKLGYVAQGFTVAALDCRGQGGPSQDVGDHYGTTLRGHIIRGLDGPPDNMLYRHIFLDTARLARVVMDMPQVDPDRVCATGGSQGGALTIACASLEPRIQRAAPVYPFLSDYQRVWQLDMDQNAYEELRLWFRHFDPQHQREQEVSPSWVTSTSSTSRRASRPRSCWAPASWTRSARPPPSTPPSTKSRRPNPSATIPTSATKPSPATTTPSSNSSLHRPPFITMHLKSLSPRRALAMSGKRDLG